MIPVEMVSSPSSSGAPEPFEDFTGAHCGLHPPRDKQGQPGETEPCPGITAEATSGRLAQGCSGDFQEAEKDENSPSRVGKVPTLKLPEVAEEPASGAHRSGESTLKGSTPLGESSSDTHADKRLNIWIERLCGGDPDKQSVSGSFSQPSTQRGLSFHSSATQSKESRTGKSQEIQSAQHAGPAEWSKQVSGIAKEEPEEVAATVCCGRLPGAVAQAPPVESSLVSEESLIRQEQNRRAEAIKQSVERTQEASRCRERAVAREAERERIRRREKEIVALEARLCTIRKRERERVQSELALWEKERRSNECKLTACRQKARQARRGVEDEVQKDRESLGADARLSAARVKIRERWIDRERQRDNARAALGLEARSTWQRAIDRERSRISRLQRDHQVRSWEGRRSTQREIERERSKDKERQERRVQHRFALEARTAGVRKIERERQLAREWEVQKQNLAFEAGAVLERERDRVNSTLESWYSDYTGQDAADDDDAWSDIFDLGNLDSDTDAGAGDLAAYGAPQDRARLASSSDVQDGEGEPSFLNELRHLPHSSPTGSHLESYKCKEIHAGTDACVKIHSTERLAARRNLEQDPRHKDDREVVLESFGQINPSAGFGPDKSVASSEPNQSVPEQGQTGHSLDHNETAVATKAKSIRKDDELETYYCNETNYSDEIDDEKSAGSSPGAEKSKQTDDKFTGKDPPVTVTCAENNEQKWNARTTGKHQNLSPLTMGSDVETENEQTHAALPGATTAHKQGGVPERGTQETTICGREEEKAQNRKFEEGDSHSLQSTKAAGDEQILHGTVSNHSNKDGSPFRRYNSLGRDAMQEAPNEWPSCRTVTRQRAARQTCEPWSESQSSKYEDDVQRALDALLEEGNKLKEWKAEFDASLRTDEDDESNLGSVIDERQAGSLFEDSSFSGRHGTPRLHNFCEERGGPEQESSTTSRQQCHKETALCPNREENREWQLAFDAWRHAMTDQDFETRLCSGREQELEWGTRFGSWQQLELERDFDQEEQCTSEAQNHNDLEMIDSERLQSVGHLDERSKRNSERAGTSARAREKVDLEVHQVGMETMPRENREQDQPWHGSLESWRNLEKLKEMHLEEQLETSLCADRERERDWEAVLNSWHEVETRREQVREQEMEADLSAYREEEIELLNNMDSWRHSETNREWDRQLGFEAGLCRGREQDADWQMASDSWRQSESKINMDRQQAFEVGVCLEQAGELDWRCFWEMWLAADIRREEERQRCFETQLGQARHTAWYWFVDAWRSRALLGRD